MNETTTNMERMRQVELDSRAARGLVERLGRRRKTVTLEEFSDCLGTNDWGRLCGALAPMLEEGALSPLKTAKSNGSTEHPLFEKYRIVGKPAPTHDLTTLHPTLVTTTYLERNPTSCDRWWNELVSLSTWLRMGSPQYDASLRERCWEVFGNEKAHELRGLAACVRNTSGRELRDLLVVREDAPEDLPFVAAPDVAAPACVVVVENRDPYLAIRSQLLAGRRALFGEPVDAVVCGYGSKVRQVKGAPLRFALESMRAIQNARVLYWGDIDREGLVILAELCDEGLVEPFTAAYEVMTQARRSDPRPSPDGRGLPMPSLDGILAGNLRNRVEAIARDGLLLPQECVCFREIEEAMR